MARGYFPGRRHSKSKGRVQLGALALAVAVMALLFAISCAAAPTPTPTPTPLPTRAPVNTPTPGPESVADNAPSSAANHAGMELFNTNCALCHGEKAVGTDAGPPLVHPYYEPWHHADFAFRNAVQNGVVSHHWFFGDMPPVPNLADDEITSIICYIRTLQKDGGLRVEETC